MLTARQTVVLDFIKQFAAENGTPPTFAEIAEGLGFESVNAAVEHVKALAKKYVLELQSNVARGIRLKQEELTPGVPLPGAWQPVRPFWPLNMLNRASCLILPWAEMPTICCGCVATARSMLAFSMAT